MSAAELGTSVVVEYSDGELEVSEFWSGSVAAEVFASYQAEVDLMEPVRPVHPVAVRFKSQEVS